jgi:DNA polymerase-3 subunit delta'
LIQAATHPDIVDVGLEEKSKQIKVEQIRAIIDFVGKTPQMGGMKIVVIEPAEQLNLNAANALLKCLEEPAGHTLIILISHAPSRLLPTIRSRCQSIILHKPAITEGDKWLSAFMPDEATRSSLLMLANNNPLLAMDYADKEMPLLYSDAIKQLVSLQNGSESLVRQAEQVDKLVDGNILVWLSIQQRIIWQLLQNSLNIHGILIKDLTLLAELSKKPGFQKRAFKMLDEIQQAIYEVQGVSNPNILLLIESLLIRWQALLRA